MICARGHAFDRAREGYWNLTQPQDRRSPAAGDRAEALDARRRWLARGFADGLIEAIARAIDAGGIADGACAIDIGCGEGTIASRLLAGRGLDACGIDLSVEGVRRAARLAREITWIVANADRFLPLDSASVDLALSVFGRRPAGELARVLRPGGVFLAVVPGEDDLIELREAAQGEGVRRDRAGGVIDELSGRFELRERRPWRARARHERAALDDALAMSYRGARARERERLAAVSELDVTLAAEIVTLVSRPALR